MGQAVRRVSRALSDLPVHLFVYGTLMDPARVRAVTGVDLESTPAVLPGFRRVPHPRLPYLSIDPSPDDCVEGVVLLNVTPASLAVLDDYETSAYRRFAVRVRLASGEEREAQAYAHAADCCAASP